VTVYWCSDNVCNLVLTTPSFNYFTNGSLLGTARPYERYTRHVWNVPYVMCINVHCTR